MSPRPPERASCRTFRALLEEAMRSWVDGRPATGELSWHEHLIGCDDCRALFAEEHALDELLALWRHDPDAEIPAGTAERLLRRLESARHLAPERAPLDRLLDLADAPVAPEGLGARVLADLESERDAAKLEALLGRVPAPEAPAELAASVLAGLEGERAAAALEALLGRVPTPEPPADLAGIVLGGLRDARRAAARERVEPARELRPVARVGGGVRRFGYALAAAAALVAAFLLWKVGDDPLRREEGVEVARNDGDPNPEARRPATVSGPRAPGPVVVGPVDPVPSTPDVAVPAAEEPPDDLLLALDVLERWDEVTDADLDALLASVDVTDEDYLFDEETAADEEDA